jgi:hypothetical protein
MVLVYGFLQFVSHFPFSSRCGAQPNAFQPICLPMRPPRNSQQQDKTHSAPADSKAQRKGRTSHRISREDRLLVRAPVVCPCRPVAALPGRRPTSSGRCLNPTDGQRTTPAVQTNGMPRMESWRNASALPHPARCRFCSFCACGIPAAGARRGESSLLSPSHAERGGGEGECQRCGRS